MISLISHLNLMIVMKKDNIYNIPCIIRVKDANFLFLHLNIHAKYTVYYDISYTKHAAMNVHCTENFVYLFKYCSKETIYLFLSITSHINCIVARCRITLSISQHVP